MDRPVRERASALFGALAHPTRLRMVELLLDGEKTVNDVASTLAVLQSSASQHLAILTRAGVLAVEQRGIWRFYRVRGPRIGRILALIEEFCQAHSLYGPDEELDAEATTGHSHHGGPGSATESERARRRR
jgi:DNA-binding transcriptional ArsR family regulator